MGALGSDCMRLAALLVVLVVASVGDPTMPAAKAEGVGACRGECKGSGEEASCGRGQGRSRSVERNRRSARRARRTRLSAESLVAESTSMAASLPA